MEKVQLNKILLALLGSQELVIRWWDSPNKAFDMKTPNELWESGEKETVKDYLIRQFDYSW
jgi:hypothetical protein